MIKLSAICFLLILEVSARAQLRVGDNNRYLVTADNQPFFWLGDTAWELFHRLTCEESDTYLKNRANKGFTVIQAVALAEMDGLHDPTAYGETPLENDDSTKPREAYFQHVDYIINKAAKLGLYVKASIICGQLRKRNGN